MVRQCEAPMTKLTSFQADIRPLFTERDIEGMKKGFNLASYDEVKAHAAAIYDRIRGIGGGVMPPPPPRGEGASPRSRVEVFAKWSGGGGHAMPPQPPRGEGPWPQSRIELFAKWIADGYQP